MGTHADDAAIATTPNTSADKAGEEGTTTEEAEEKVDDVNKVEADVAMIDSMMDDESAAEKPDKESEDQEMMHDAVEDSEEAPKNDQLPGTAAAAYFKASEEYIDSFIKATTV